MTKITSAEAVFVSGSTMALSPNAADTVEAILRAAGGTRVLDLDFDSGLWSADEARGDVRGDARRRRRPDRKRGRRQDHLRALWQPQRDHPLYRVGGWLRRGGHHPERAGAIAVDDNILHEVDAIETELVDASGQHDAFVGGFLHRHPRRRVDGGRAASRPRRRGHHADHPGPMTTMSVDEVSTAGGRGRRRRTRALIEWRPPVTQNSDRTEAIYPSTRTG